MAFTLAQVEKLEQLADQSKSLSANQAKKVLLKAGIITPQGELIEPLRGGKKPLLNINKKRAP